MARTTWDWAPRRVCEEYVFPTEEELGDADAWELLPDFSGFEGRRVRVTIEEVIPQTGDTVIIKN